MSETEDNETFQSITKKEKTDFLTALNMSLYDEDYAEGVPLFVIKKNMSRNGCNVELTRVAAIAAHLVEIDESICRSGKSGEGLYKLRSKQASHTRALIYRTTKIIIKQDSLDNGIPARIVVS